MSYQSLPSLFSIPTMSLQPRPQNHTISRNIRLLGRVLNPRDTPPRVTLGNKSVLSLALTIEQESQANDGSDTKNGTNHRTGDSTLGETGLDRLNGGVVVVVVAVVVRWDRAARWLWVSGVERRTIVAVTREIGRETSGSGCRDVVLRVGCVEARDCVLWEVGSADIP